MQNVGARYELRHLSQVKNLDEVTLSVLKAMAGRTKPYLIPVQEKILALIEQEYKVISLCNLKLHTYCRHFAFMSTICGHFIGKKCCGHYFIQLFSSYLR
jgi:hypothetical protein